MSKQTAISNVNKKYRENQENGYTNQYYSTVDNVNRLLEEYEQEQREEEERRYRQRQEEYQREYSQFQAERNAEIAKSIKLSSPLEMENRAQQERVERMNTGPNKLTPALEAGVQANAGQNGLTPYQVFMQAQMAKVPTAPVKEEKQDTRTDLQLFNDYLKQTARANSMDRMATDYTQGVQGRSPTASEQMLGMSDQGIQQRLYDPTYTTRLSAIGERMENQRAKADKAADLYNSVTTEKKLQKEREKYLPLMSNPDFLKNSQGSQAIADAGMATATGSNAKARLYRDIYYRGTAGIDGKGVTDSAARNVNDEEAAMFFYLWNTQGSDAAETYYNDYVKNRASQRQMELIQDQARAYGEYDPIGASVRSVGTQIMSGVGLVDMAFQNISRLVGITSASNPLNYYSPAQSFGLKTDAYREGASDYIVRLAADELERAGFKNPEKYAKVAGFLYQTGMSMADSGVAALLVSLGIPEPLTLANMGAAAGTRAIRDARERGATDGQALAFGISSAIMEALFEKISMDKILEPSYADTVKAHIWNAVSQSFTEGSEEVMTTLANTAMDQLIMGDKSELFTRQRELMEQGVSEKEALGAAFKQWGTQVLGDFLGGLISGFGMGGIKEAGYAAGALRNRVNNELLGVDIQNMVNASQAEQRLRQQYEQQNAPQQQQQTKLTIPSQETVSARQADPLGYAMNKATSGETVTKQDARAIIENPQALQALRDSGVLTGKVTNDSEGRGKVVDAVNALAENQRQTAEIPAAAENISQEAAQIPQETAQAAPVPAQENAQQEERVSTPPVPRAQESALEAATEGKLRIPEQKNTPPVPRSGLTVRSVNDTLNENRQEGTNGQAETAASSEAERARKESADFREAANKAAGSKVLDRAEWNAGLGRLLQAVRNARDSRNYEQRRSEAARITNQAEAGNPDRLSAKDLGLANGSDDKLAVEVAAKILGPDAEEAVARLAKQGVTLRFISGQMRLNKLDSNGKPVQVRAYVSEDRKNIIVQADNPRVTWQQLLAHEELHKLIKENAEYRKSVMDALLADKKVAPYLSQIIDRYADAYHTVDLEATDEEIIEELLADYRAGFDMLDPLGTNRTLSKVTKAAAKDIRAVERKTLEKRVETSRPVSVSDEDKASREFDTKYMQAAYRYNEQDNRVPASLMNDVAKVRETIKAKLDEIQDVARLPEDVAGNTYFKNGSYNGSEENTTVCPRSVSVDALADAVGDALGRPLTIEETVYIAQQAFHFTDVPQCLYCYVAMDRMAKRQLLGEYINKRTQVYADFESGMSRAEALSAFKERETAGGKQWSGDKQKRFNLWANNYEAGNQTVRLSNLSSEAAVEKALSDDSLRAETEDALRYAQNASWAKKRVGYTAYNNHILKWDQKRINDLNSMFGLRLYSFSDYSPAYILENMQMVTDAAVRGLKMLAYTKELDFVRIFAGTGMNINVSTFGMDSGDGTVHMDAMQGADWKEAQKLREKFPNVGITFVATNDNQVNWALDQDWIDVVIPFHMVKTGATVADILGYKNYTGETSDKKIAGLKAKQKEIFPNQHQNDKQKYLDALKKANLTPRFERWMDNPNYMKLVNETRRSAQDTPAVQPKFDQEAVDAALKSLDDMVKRGGYGVPIGGSLDNLVDIAEEMSDEIRKGVAQDLREHNRQLKERQTGKASTEIGAYDIDDSTLYSMQKQLRELKKQMDSYKEAPEYQEMLAAVDAHLAREGSRFEKDEDFDAALKKYAEWQDSSGYSDVYQQHEALSKEVENAERQLRKRKEEEAKRAKEAYRAEYSPEMAAKYATKAARKFGTTSRFDLAGYLTTSGSLLDFSHRQGHRVQDHREIADVLDFLPEDHDYSDGMIEFMNLGNIRLQSYGIDISKAPNAKQISVLRRFFNSLDGEVTIDFSDENGNTVGSIDYPEGTRSDRIFADMQKYFDTGKVPELSTTAQFHGNYSTEIDTDYLAAVDRGDMETAQKMVDEAAKAAGYTVKAYHGTPNKFNVFLKSRIGSTTDYGWFGRGFYFTTKKDVAEVYAGYLNDSNVIEAYLKVQNPFVFSNYPGGENMSAGEVMDAVLGKKYGSRGEMTEEDKAQRSEDFTDWLRDNGYDAAEIWSQIMILDSEQAKRTDPVTYDNDGNVIPLSERFNSEKEDIRYSREINAEAENDEQTLGKINSRINELQENLDMAEYNDATPEDQRTWRNELVKLEYQKDQLIAKERSLSKKTSINDLLANLDSYRRSDLESLAEQVSDSAWDDYEELSDDDLRKALRDVLEERAADYTELERQAPKYGYSVRPIQAERAKGSASIEIDPDVAAQFSPEGIDKRQVSELLSENEELKQKLKKAKAQIKTSDRTQPREEDVRRMAKDILKAYDSEASVSGITDSLRELAHTVMSNDTRWTDVHDQAVKIAGRILENSNVLINEDSDWNREIRNDIRSTAISFKNKNDIPDYNEWRKENFGRLRISNNGMPVETRWQELQDTYGKYYFPEEITNPTDQILHLAELWDRLQDVYDNPYSADMAEATQFLANDIIDRVISEEIRQAPTTYADRAEARIARETLRGELRVQKVKERLQAERERRNEKIAELKEHYKSKEAKGRENRKARDMRAKIIDHAKQMTTELLKPTDKKHVPESLRKSVAAVLSAIDLGSGYDTTTGQDGKTLRVGRGTEGAEQTKRTKAFLELRETLLKEADGLVLDPELLGTVEEPGNLTRLVTELADVPIANMNTEQLQVVYDALRGIEGAVKSANRMLSSARWAAVSEAADAIRGENSAKHAPLQLAGAAGRVQDLTRLDMLTPEGYFHRLGKSGQAVFKMLRGAQDQFITNMAKATEDTQKIVGDTDVGALEKEKHTVTMGGEEVTMTTAQIMELYCLMQRDQGLQHITTGGIMVEPVRQGIKQTTQTEPVHPSMEELLDAVRLLTPDEIRMADAMQDYLSKDMAELGNAATLAVYGYKKFGQEAKYWKIRSNKNEIQQSIEKETQTTSVANRGFTKAVNPNANTSVKIGSIFDTYSQSVNDMATYAAWLAVGEDVNRIRNYVFRDSEGQRTGTVKGVLDRVIGSGGANYLQRLLADIANGAGMDDTGLTSGFVGAYKAAAIGANIRVIIQQPTAILRAAEMIDPKYLASGLKNPMKAFERAKEYSPIAQWKDWGYFDINTGRKMKDVLFESSSKLEKVRQVSMAMAGKADSFAWGQLWGAVEAETRDKGLKPGTKEFYEACAERFNDIIDHTQVVDGILQRSQIMRSKNAITRMAVSFMSEPTKQYNQFMSAVYDYKHSGDKKQAKQMLARTTFSMLAAGIMNVLAQSVVDALRNGDREKKYWEKLLQSFLGYNPDDDTFGEKFKTFAFSNMGELINPATYLPYAKDIMSIIQGYSVERMDMDGLSDTITAITRLAKAINGEGKQTVGYSLGKAIEQGAKLLGLSAYNVDRDLTALITTIANDADMPVLQYYLNRYRYKPSENLSKDLKGILWDARQKNDGSYDIIVEHLLKDGYTQEQIDKVVVQKVSDESGFTDARKAADAEGNNNGSYDLSETLEALGNATLTEEDRDVLLEAKLSDKQYGNYTTLLQYSDYDTWLSVMREMPATLSQAKIEAVLDKRDDLTTTQKAAYWQVLSGSKSTKNNPYSQEVGAEILNAKAESQPDAEPEKVAQMRTTLSGLGLQDSKVDALAPVLGGDGSNTSKWRAVANQNLGKDQQDAVLKSIMTDAMYRNWSIASGESISLDSYVKGREAYVDLDNSGTDQNGEWTAALEKVDFDKDASRNNYIKGVLWQIYTGSTSTKNNPFDKAGGQAVLDAKSKGGGKGTGSNAPARIPTLRIPAAPTVTKPTSGLRIRGTQPTTAPRSGLRIRAK